MHGVAAVHGPTAGAYGDRGGPLKPPELVCVGGARGLDGAPAPRKHSERGGEPQHEVQRGRVRDGVREGDGHAQEVAAVVEQAVGEAPKRSGELRRWGRGLPPRPHATGAALAARTRAVPRANAVPGPHARRGHELRGHAHACGHAGLAEARLLRRHARSALDGSLPSTTHAARCYRVLSMVCLRARCLRLHAGSHEYTKFSNAASPAQLQLLRMYTKFSICSSSSSSQQ